MHHTIIMWTMRLAVSILLTMSRITGSDSEAGHSGLFLVTRDKVYKVDMETSEKTVITDGLSGGAAIDYDLEKRVLVLNDKIEKCLYKVNLDTGNKTVLVRFRIHTPDGLAVDWIHGNVYWTDATTDTIGVVSLDGSWRKVLFDEDLKGSLAIVVNPLEGWMFWTDWVRSTIERAGMDGTQRSVIATTGGWPMALTLDLDSRKIYCIDLKLDRIASSDYDGSNVKVVLHSTPAIVQPFAIDLFEDWMFWGDWEVDKIYKAKKLTGESIEIVASGFDTTPMGIRILHSSKQPKGINYCEESAECSHLCLPAPRTTEDSKNFTCACPDGMELTDDQKNCTVKNISTGGETSTSSHTTTIDATTAELTLPPLPSLPPLPPTQATDVNTSSTTDACRYLSPFPCANGRCIRKQWRCDGHDDCGDNSDEQNCNCLHPRTIPCDNGDGCKPQNWLCDGAVDCRDRSDERGCGPLTTSPATPTACGGDIYQPSGVIQSPGYPNRYPHSAHCVWIIHAPNSSQIILNVTDFAMEDHDECSFDFLEIRKGSDETSPLLGTHCGYRVKPIIVSGSNTLRLEFKSDDGRSAQGFQIYFNTSAAVDNGNSSTDCGGDRTDDNGEISSPRHSEGEQYPHNVDCTWLITAPENHIIRLNFTSFNVEIYSGTCQYDYVLVENAEGSNSGKYCGTTLPPVIWSRNDTLTVTFHADGSVSQDGFKARYEFIDLSESCGVENRTDDNGEISSPTHPGREEYPNNVDCTWLITAPEGHRIRLTFSSFSLEGSLTGSCGSDYVMVKEADGSDIGRYCGTTVPPVIRSQSNTLTVTFHADGSVSRAGFKARYEFFNESESSPPGCAEKLTDDNGVISSPSHLDRYPHNVDCTWMINAPKGHRILLTFTRFNVEAAIYDDTCPNDYVLVKGADLFHSGRFCGSSLPPVITSINNTLTVVFHTDHSVAYEGFTAKYHFSNASRPPGCGENLTDDNGVISSPSHPRAYPHNVDCTWTIKAPQGHRIQLTFSRFNVEEPLSGDTCSMDYVLVKEADGVSLGRFCGSSLPPAITSKNNTLTVEFHTDYNVAYEGFSANYHFSHEHSSDPEDFPVTGPYEHETTTYEVESVPYVHVTDASLPSSSTTHAAHPFRNGSLPGTEKEETGGAGETAGTILGILIGTMAVSAVGFCIYKQHLRRNTIIHFQNPVYKKIAVDPTSSESGSPKESVTLPI